MGSGRLADRRQSRAVARGRPHAARPGREFDMHTASAFTAALLMVPLLACPNSGDGTSGPTSPPGSTPPGSTPTPSPTHAGLKLVDIIPASLSGETNQDSEPFLAIHSSPTVL